MATHSVLANDARGLADLRIRRTSRREKIVALGARGHILPLLVDLGARGQILPLLVDLIAHSR
jgi:hypothetical protein